MSWSRTKHGAVCEDRSQDLMSSLNPDSNYTVKNYHRKADLTKSSEKNDIRHMAFS